MKFFRENHAIRQTATLVIVSMGVGLLASCQKKDEAPSSKVESKTESSGSLDASNLPAHSLRIKAKLVEIPGSFPANDLYNYVYVMKYEVTQIESGTYQDKDILVGHYNPRISRSDIKDEMDSLVDGNVTTFEEEASQELTLVPLESSFTGAVEDDFYQDKRPRWYAIRADKN